MSRIGRKPIPVPDKVKVAVKSGEVSLTGPAGAQVVRFKPEVQVRWAENEKAVHVAVDEAKAAEDRHLAALWGTTRALIAAAIEGVSKGYEKSMEVVGVGWTAAVTGSQLKLVLGFANPIIMPIPAGLKVVVEKQIVKISGADKKAVGQFASDMRAKRKPEPYNGKGVKYTTETIKRKSGKAFGSA